MRYEWREARIDADNPWAPSRYSPADELNAFEAEGWEIVKIIEVPTRHPRLTVLMRRPAENQQQEERDG